jgi:hypothetical protein
MLRVKLTKAEEKRYRALADKRGFSFSVLVRHCLEKEYINEEQFGPGTTSRSLHAHTKRRPGDTGPA